MNPKGAFKESFCRRLFGQIVESRISNHKRLVIHNIHKLGIVHRDIKLENILVGDDYDLHIADLGFACQGIDDKGRQRKLTDYLGT
jgi:serine/threonine protein kinase